ncbi:hypothetical protein IW262DRAFT_1368270 [Armillaria fumosa]|nr:hypothetical protein IW262DRAFT_1368270 [Armillaria fumosa]
MTPLMWNMSGLLTVQLGQCSASTTRTFWQENTQRSFAFEKNKLTRPALPTNDGTYIVTSLIPNESTSPTLHNGTHSFDVCSTE